MTIPMPEPSGWIMDGGAGGTLRYQRGPISQIQSLIHSNAPVWEERDIQKYVEAYASAKVREALEEAAMIPRAYAESLDRQGWGNRFPDELTAIFNASTNMADRIRALIPPLPGPVEP